MVRVDPARKVVVSAGGETRYDQLVLATGSAPFIIPVQDRDLPGVVTYRDLEDTNAMIAATKPGAHAADLVRAHYAKGQAILRVLITDAVAQGEVFAPMHWTGDTASAARIDVLVPALVDPISGQPESNAASVGLSHFAAAWYGFAVSAADVTPRSDYWAKGRLAGGWRGCPVPVNPTPAPRSVPACR